MGDRKYSFRERLNGWYVLMRAAFDYLRYPANVEDHLYRALCLRVRAAGRDPWKGKGGSRG